MCVRLVVKLLRFDSRPVRVLANLVSDVTTHMWANHETNAVRHLPLSPGMSFAYLRQWHSAAANLSAGLASLVERRVGLAYIQGGPKMAQFLCTLNFIKY